MKNETEDRRAFDVTGKIEPFDGQAAFEAEVEPLVDQLVAKCKEHGFPVNINITFSGEGEVCNGKFHQLSVCKVIDGRTNLLMAVIAFMSQNPEAELLEQVYTIMGKYTVYKRLKESMGSGDDMTRQMLAQAFKMAAESGR